MKNFTPFLSVLLFTFLAQPLAQASSSLERTELKIMEGPSASDLRQARALLDEAIEALDRGDRATADVKLAEARVIQNKRRTVKKIFAAAFVTDDHDAGGLTNALAAESRPGLEDSCYVGERDEALHLLEFALRGDYLNFDEIWYENPRRGRGNSLFVDWVDGPGGHRARIAIAPCK